MLIKINYENAAISPSGENQRISINKDYSLQERNSKLLRNVLTLEKIPRSLFLQNYQDQ